MLYAIFCIRHTYNIIPLSCITQQKKLCRNRRSQYFFSIFLLILFLSFCSLTNATLKSSFLYKYLLFFLLLMYFSSFLRFYFIFWIFVIIIILYTSSSFLWRLPGRSSSNSNSSKQHHHHHHRITHNTHNRNGRTPRHTTRTESILNGKKIPESLP